MALISVYNDYGIFHLLSITTSTKSCRNEVNIRSCPFGDRYPYDIPVTLKWFMHPWLQECFLSLKYVEIEKPGIKIETPTKLTLLFVDKSAFH